MGPDDRQHTVWALVVTVKERMCRLEQGVQGGKELTMGHLTAELPPQHLNQVQPGAIGGQIQQHQPSSCGANDGFNLIIRMGIGMIPRHIDGARGMPVDQGLQQFGDLLAPLAAAEQHDGFDCMIVDGAQPIALVRLPWGRNHDLLTSRTPQGAQGGQPTEIEFVSIVKHLTSFQMVAAVFNRLFFTAYSGSGRLIVCWGRLRTMSACFSARRIVSSETRMPVLSAR